MKPYPGDIKPVDPDLPKDGFGGIEGGSDE